MIMDNHSPSNNDCCFCRDIADRANNSGRAKSTFRNVVCQESPHFVAFPSLSPLAPGHSLVIPKHHTTSLAQISPEHREELTTFTRHVEQIVSRAFGSVTSFEHGVGRSKHGGCGVTHAHLHILPLRGNHTLAVHNTVQTTFACQTHNALVSFFDAVHYDDTYLWFGHYDHSVIATVAEDISSQFMRRRIGGLLGVTDWDWRSYTNWEAYDLTRDTLLAGR
jgi:diadenosine tetraphosphate (Ap4A) HIT family hydrolase